MQSQVVVTSSGFVFPEFNNERERIKAFSKKFKSVDILDAFSKIYTDLSVDKNKLHNEAGQPLYITPMSPVNDKVYFGQVIKFNKNGAEIYNPQFNERFITKEDFTKYPLFQNYLLNNQNQVYFKVKKINNMQNTVEVNVLEAYYDRWANDIIKMGEYKRPVEVYDLRLMPGGFLGKIDIPYLSQMLGVPFFLDAFIPGSQIALNIEKNFSKWVDQKVDVIVNKFVKNNGRWSIMVSRKKHLQNIGNINIAELFTYKDNKETYKTIYDGVVTGIINTNQKCGIFVEIPSENFTGLVPCNPGELVKYRPGTDIKVRIKEFEVRENKKPIVYKRVLNTQNKQNKVQSKWEETDIIEYVNIKPIFDFA